MSLSFENSGNLVQGAIVIFSGHRPFEFLEENAKILKFAINGTQVAVIEWPMSISTVERVHRFWGIKNQVLWLLCIDMVDTLMFIRFLIATS